MIATRKAKMLGRLLNGVAAQLLLKIRIAQHFVCERAANVSDPTFKAIGIELRWQKPLTQCSKTMNSIFLNV